MTYLCGGLRALGFLGCTMVAALAKGRTSGRRLRYRLCLEVEV